MQKIRMQIGKAPSINEALERFFTACKIKNLSTTTIKTYHDHFRLFKQFFDCEQPIDRVTERDIDNFILFLFERNIKSTTINSYLRTIRVFLYWCMDKNYMLKFTIPKIKEDVVPKETYNEDELRKLLKKPQIGLCSFVEYKTYVLTCFLIATGQRLGATISLKKSDINFSNNTITFKRTKNRNSHSINIPKSLKPILIEYLTFLPDDIEWLFPNAYGQKAKLKTIQENLLTYNRSKGVDKTSAHLYRHTFAKTWIQNGYNQLELMRILDHTTVDMTNKYVNLYGSEVNIDKCDILGQYYNKKISIKKRN